MPEENFYNIEMKNIRDFNSSVQFLLTDIDDTLTDDGRLGPEAYESLWKLHSVGIHVIPVTGRPAGWCEMIARQWPVSGVVGENGAFYFRYHQNRMTRHFALDEKTRNENQKKLEVIRREVLTQVSGAAVASDQFCRMFDLAIDFCEDVPALPKSEIQRILKIFEQAGAQAKVSSIHVNGWFGHYNKLSQSLEFLQNEFGLSPTSAKHKCGFVGDSPNDEPMWEFFPHGFAVANINNFAAEIIHKPTYVANHRGGKGFAEIAEKILSLTK